MGKAMNSKLNHRLSAVAVLLLAGMTLANAQPQGGRGGGGGGGARVGRFKNYPADAVNRGATVVAAAAAALDLAGVCDSIVHLHDGRVWE